MRHLFYLPLFFTTCFLINISHSQPQRIIHEVPTIADEVPNIPEELIESGKLSKFIALSVPDDQRWNPDGVNLNANGAVFAIGQGENEFGSCFIGGHFDSIGGIAAKGLAFFDDHATTKTFTEVGGGVQGGDVYTIIPIPYSSEVYVGGNFTKAGNIEAHSIAHWTGSHWESLGNGTDSTVLALAFVGSSLFVGGNFRSAGGQTANYIAIWDTTNKTWQPIIDGAINGMNGGVSAIALTQWGDLFVGGGFTKAGSVPANKIADYASGKWVALDRGLEGVNSYISCIMPSGPNEFYTGGNFATAGGQPHHNIAFWQTTGWQDLGDQFNIGFDKPVYAITNMHYGLTYVGGEIQNAGDSTCNYIVQWTGGVWQSLGSGLEGRCYALAGKFLAISQPPDYYNNHLYVGGKFSQAGLKPSKNFAVWGAAHSGSVKQNPSLASEIFFHISPNPIQTSATISFMLPEQMNTTLSIIDILGREVISLGSGIRKTGVQEIRIDATRLIQGAYYCRLQAQGQNITAKFTVIK